MQLLAGLAAGAFFAAVIWGLHAVWRRRCVAAARQAAAMLDGRFEEEGRRFSGGTIHGRKDDRHIVVEFTVGSSGGPARTTASTGLKHPLERPIRVRRRLFGGWTGAESLPPDAAALLLRLQAFRSAGLLAAGTTLSVEAGGVLHVAARIVDLASIAAAFARELDRS